MIPLSAKQISLDSPFNYRESFSKLIIFAEYIALFLKSAWF